MNQRLFASLVVIPMSFIGGCGAKEQSKDTTVRVTWHQDVAPLVSESCVGCHADGGIAPFHLRALLFTLTRCFTCPVSSKRAAFGFDCTRDAPR